MVDNDPIGNAIWDFHKYKKAEDIQVSSPSLADDVIPVDYLFRKYDNFPLLEKKAMQYCKGEILDIGAAAGPHSKYLLQNNAAITTVEYSKGAHQYLKESLPNAKHYLSPILNFNHGSYDTILLLMNGIGMAGTLQRMKFFLQHISKLLAPGGTIICDSTDVCYLYNTALGRKRTEKEYYGEFQFKMKYKESEGESLDWIYIDLKELEKCALEAKLTLSLLAQDGYKFLVQLKKEA